MSSYTFHYVITGTIRYSAQQDGGWGGGGGGILHCIFRLWHSSKSLNEERLFELLVDEEESLTSALAIFDPLCLADARIQANRCTGTARL